jgi:secernin
MGSDMVVALGTATTGERTFFGQNCHRPARETQVLRLQPGRSFSMGEKIRSQFLELPQARKTLTVLGIQPQAHWGYVHGLNEHSLVMGCASLKTNLCCSGPTLLGTDLVRLVLERCGNARQGVDLLTDLVERYGQGLTPGDPELGEADHAFLIADPREAFAVETSGHYWVSQEISRVRALSDVSVVRQDWSRIARGLAGEAITQGWWPADGTKLDFAGALSTTPSGLASGLRRWGRATLLLEEQSGHIDLPFLRRLLGDHYEDTCDETDPLEPGEGPTPLCQHAAPLATSATAGSFVAALETDPERVPVLWCAFGPPCINIYFPIFLAGDLLAPHATRTELRGASLPEYVRGKMQRIASQRETWALARAVVADLQSQLDEETSAFSAEAARLKKRAEIEELRRQTGFFTQHTLEQFDKVMEQIRTTSARSSSKTPAGTPG